MSEQELPSREDAERAFEEAYVQGYQRGWHAAIDAARRSMATCLRQYAPGMLVRVVDWPNSPFATSPDHEAFLAALDAAREATRARGE